MALFARFRCSRALGDSLVKIYAILSCTQVNLTPFRLSFNKLVFSFWSEPEQLTPKESIFLGASEGSSYYYSSIPISTRD